jgi:hypothetical protein
VLREYRIVDAASARYALSLRIKTRFIVESETLSHEEAERVGRDLSGLSQACGCDLGARFLMISICACSILLLAMWRPAWAHPIYFLSAAALACFLAAGIGKAIGIFQAKRELRAQLLQLCGQFERQEASLHGMHR